MIDAALRTMIDEVLPARGKLCDLAVESRAQAPIWNSAMLSSVHTLLDLSALTDRADRLVKAAHAAGADAADAVAVRSMSLAIEVRDGNTEESERAEGDDLGLRVFVGRRQAVVSTNEVTANGAGGTRRRDGAGDARGQVRRPRRRQTAGPQVSRARPDRSRPAQCAGA
jgi:hypothetical protein